MHQPSTLIPPPCASASASPLGAFLFLSARRRFGSAEWSRARSPPRSQLDEGPDDTCRARGAAGGAPGARSRRALSDADTMSTS